MHEMKIGREVDNFLSQSRCLSGPNRRHSIPRWPYRPHPYTLVSPPSFPECEYKERPLIDLARLMTPEFLYLGVWTFRPPIRLQGRIRLYGEYRTSGLGHAA